MQIQSIQNNNIKFTGSSAKALKGVFMTANWEGIGDEIRKLEPKTGLKIYSLNDAGEISSNSAIPETESIPYVMWAQDLFNIGEKKLQYETVYNPAPEIINNIANKLQKILGLQKERYTYHLQGGNFITTENNNYKEALVGAYDLKRLSKEEVAKRLDVDRVIEMPQVAAHLDTFMFVDDNKHAFICDDELMLKDIAQGVINTEEYIKANYSKMTISEKIKYTEIANKLGKAYYTFKTIVNCSPYKSADEAIKVLENAGYTTTRIPGRLYGFVQENNQLQHQYGTNFANAILHKNTAGDTVIITNESANDVCFGIDKEVENKIGFSFKKKFIDRVSPFIKKENIHFVSGKNNGVFNLLANFGGIHCISSEIR